MPEVAYIRRQTEIASASAILAGDELSKQNALDSVSAQPAAVIDALLAMADHSTALRVMRERMTPSTLQAAVDRGHHAAAALACVTSAIDDDVVHSVATLCARERDAALALAAWHYSVISRSELFELCRGAELTCTLVAAVAEQMSDIDALQALSHASFLSRSSSTKRLAAATLPVAPIDRARCVKDSELLMSLMRNEYSPPDALARMITDAGNDLFTVVTAVLSTPGPVPTAALQAISDALKTEPDIAGCVARREWRAEDLAAFPELITECVNTLNERHDQARHALARTLQERLPDCNCDTVLALLHNISDPATRIEIALGVLGSGRPIWREAILVLKEAYGSLECDSARKMYKVATSAALLAAADETPCPSLLESIDRARTAVEMMQQLPELTDSDGFSRLLSAIAESK